MAEIDAEDGPPGGVQEADIVDVYFDAAGAAAATGQFAGEYSEESAEENDPEAAADLANKNKKSPGRHKEGSGLKRTASPAVADKCVVCHDDASHDDANITTACNHSYCIGCFKKWAFLLNPAAEKLDCAACRADILPLVKEHCAEELAKEPPAAEAGFRLQDDDTRHAEALVEDGEDGAGNIDDLINDDPTDIVDNVPDAVNADESLLAENVDRVLPGRTRQEQAAAEAAAEAAAAPADSSSDEEPEDAEERARAETAAGEDKTERLIGIREQAIQQRSLAHFIIKAEDKAAKVEQGCVIFTSDGGSEEDTRPSRREKGRSDSVRSPVPSRSFQRTQGLPTPWVRVCRSWEARGGQAGGQAGQGGRGTASALEKKKKRKT